MDYNEKRNWKMQMNPDYEKNQRRGRVWGGIILVAIGGALLAKTMGVLLPFWLFKWPMIPILAGLYSLGKNGFKRAGGLIPIAIGSVFMVDVIFPGQEYRNFLIPILIITIGLFMVLRPKRKRNKEFAESWTQKENAEIDNTDLLQVDSIFGGVQKHIISKNFLGGNINTVFAGTEINCMQAELGDNAILDINCIFGGVEITVPSSWKIQNELTAILGGVDDTRMMHTTDMENAKILTIKGSVVFGGVSIKGY